MKPENKWMDAEAAEGEEGPPQRVFKKEAAEAVALHMQLQRVMGHMEKLFTDQRQLVMARYPSLAADHLAQSANAERTGYLYKQGGLDRRRWQKRWFVLVDDFLFYYSSSSSATPKGIVRLDRLRAKPARPHDDPEREHAFSLPAQKKLYVLAASYIEERDEWLEAINRASFFVTGLSS